LGFRLNIIILLCCHLVIFGRLACSASARGLAFKKEAKPEKRGEMEMGTGNSSSDVA
jgi:hypothetical protein